MSYAKVQDGKIVKYPYEISSLKRDYPNTSFPANLTRVDLAAFGVMKVHLTPKPKARINYRVVEDEPYVLAGICYQKWREIELNESEKAQQLREKQDAIRAQRNQKLKDCDWTQLPDAKVSQSAWAQYRQELRDLTKQESFPFDVVWPSEPTKETETLSQREALKKAKGQELVTIRQKKRGINL